jgi:hypothetical protein
MRMPGSVRASALALTAVAATAFTGTACSSSKDDTTTVVPASAPASASTPASAATTKATGKQQQQGDSTKAALKGKISKEPEAKGMPDVFINCMVDVMVKYGDKDSIQSYIDGKIKADDIKGLKTHEANTAGFKCADLVTAPPSSH